MLLLSFCAPKETSQEGPVDLDFIARGDSLLQSEVDMALINAPAEHESLSWQDGRAPAETEPLSVEDGGAPAETESSSVEDEKEEEKNIPSIIALNAQTMPVSEPHAGSPGGIIADTLRVFQCETSHAKSQDSFFLYVLNYRIHTLGAHPLCEVIRVTNIKKVLAYAHYQRKHCDNYTSKFIDDLEQHQCTQIITLMPANENEI